MDGKSTPHTPPLMYIVSKCDSHNLFDDDSSVTENTNINIVRPNHQINVAK